MSPEQIQELLAAYQEQLLVEDANRSDQHLLNPSHYQALQHVHWMVNEVMKTKNMPEQKINRWLGFIQGVLWSTGKYNIYEMRHHNLGSAKPGEKPTE